MIRYKIPERYLLGFRLLAKMSKENTAQIATIFKNMPLVGEEGKEEKIPDIDLKISSNELLALIQAINSLLGLWNSEELTQEDIATSIAESFSSQIEDSTEKEKNQLSNNLIEILQNSSNAKLNNKAIGLLREGNLIFQDARIITDIRLVFDDNISKSNQFAIVIHNLKIDYEENEEDKTFYFQLENKSLKILKKHIERALEKEKLIVDKTFNQNLQFLNIPK